MLSNGKGPSFQNWISSIPEITKWMGIAIFLFSAGANFGYPNLYYIAFLPDEILKGQIWRLVTPFLFFGKLGFGVLMGLFFFLRFSGDLEKDYFFGRKADYIWCLILGGITMLSIAYFLELPFLSSCFKSYLVYLSCNLFPNRNLGLMFIPVKIQSVYFPWVLVLMNLLFGQSILMDLIGYFVGHLYYFFLKQWPTRSNGRIPFFMKTPGILEKIVEPERLTQYTPKWAGNGYRLNE